MRVLFFGIFWPQILDCRSLEDPWLNPHSCGLAEPSYVCDPDHLLEDHQRNRVHESIVDLKQVELPCGDQEYTPNFRVVLLQTLANQEMEAYAHELRSQWGLGSSACDESGLLVVALGSRKMALSTGSGLKLSSDRASQVLDAVKLHIREDLSEALVAGLKKTQELLLISRDGQSDWGWLILPGFLLIVFLIGWYQSRQERKYLLALTELERSRALALADSFEQETCAICLETLHNLEESPLTSPSRETELLICGHRFCRPCLDEWFDRETSCPVCRNRPPTLETEPHIVNFQRGIRDLQTSYPQFIQDDLVFRRPRGVRQSDRPSSSSMGFGGGHTRGGSASSSW